MNTDSRMQINQIGLTNYVPPRSIRDGGRAQLELIYDSKALPNRV